MLRKTPFVVSEYYHIYNRGTDKKIIFADSNDYNRFMILLYLCNDVNPVSIGRILCKGRSFTELMNIERGDTIVDIGAYCLMRNHFHILLREKVDGGISKFMKKISTAFSMYFNVKYERAGTLFEGRFKSKHVDNDPYLNWLFSYIHLNPVKFIDPDWQNGAMPQLQKIKEFMKNYHYSSYHDYFLGDRKETVILNKEMFPVYFSPTKDTSDLVKNFKPL